MGIFKSTLIENPSNYYPTIARTETTEPWIMVAPGEPWPDRPKHTCTDGYTRGWVLTMRIKWQTLGPIPDRHWRDCQGCYYDRVKRHSRQVEHELGEGVLWWLEVSDHQIFKRYRDKWRQWHCRKGIEVKYRAYPQENGGYFVIHNQETEGGELVPTDRAGLFGLLHGWLKTPEKSNVSSSKGWGGPHQGYKGDGRAKQMEQDGGDPGPVFQFWSDKEHIKKPANALGINLKKHRGKCELDPREIDHLLKSAGLRYYARDMGTTWETFLEAVQAEWGDWQPTPSQPKPETKTWVTAVKNWKGSPTVAAMLWGEKETEVTDEPQEYRPTNLATSQGVRYA